MTEDWVSTTAKVTSCRFQSPGLSTLAFGFQRGEKFRISFDYYAHGRLYSDEFQSARAVPQDTQFGISYNPLDPGQNDRTNVSSQARNRTRPATFVIGAAGSVALSLVWLAVLRGCF